MISRYMAAGPLKEDPGSISRKRRKNLEDIFYMSSHNPVSAALRFQLANIEIRNMVLDQYPDRMNHPAMVDVIETYYIPFVRKMHYNYSAIALHPVKVKKIRVEGIDHPIPIPLIYEDLAFTVDREQDEKDKTVYHLAVRDLEGEDVDFVCESQRGGGPNFHNADFISEGGSFLPEWRRYQKALRNKDEFYDKQRNQKICLKRVVPAQLKQIDEEEDRHKRLLLEHMNPGMYKSGKNATMDVTETDKAIFLPTMYDATHYQPSLPDMIDEEKEYTILTRKAASDYSVPHSIFQPGGGHGEERFNEMQLTFEKQRTSSVYVDIAEDLAQGVRQFLHFAFDKQDIPVFIPIRPQATPQEIELMAENGRISQTTANELLYSLFSIHPKHAEFGKKRDYVLNKG